MAMKLNQREAKVADACFLTTCGGGGMDSQKSSVSQADRELAAQWFFDPQCIEDHAIQIADHRTASVARREAEIVAYLWKHGMNNSAIAVDEFIKIKNGGGA